ncbi:putative fucosyl transferase [Prochlorococcus marinus str. MIT 9314]|uniref:Putative fucosyl transferase n=2 Tax=Prochlorococcaceae TaxID=2881426 RepID=A0A0A2AHM2_PROMR|nr:putative fucosyl transferase [Prochlorococcus marinus str. MIT 9314]
MMLIGISSYYGEANFKDMEKQSEDYRVFNDGLRITEVSRRGLEFFKECKKSAIYLENYNKENHSRYDLIIFWDIPNLINLFKIKFRNIIFKTRTILIIEDTPVARSRNLLMIPFLFQKIILNTIDSNYKFRNYKTSTFTLPTLPSVKEIKDMKSFINNSKRKKKINFIASNKNALNKNSSFLFREKIVKDLNLYEGKIFDLYGKGWERRQIPMDMPLIFIILRNKYIKKLVLKFINIFGYSTKSNGTVKLKSETLNQYDFSLAIEPFLGRPKIILEKLFDPMLAGSIPIYYGPEINSIPKDCYLRINKRGALKKISNYVNKMSEEKKEIYRRNIYEFLISKAADKYRYKTYAKFLLNEIIS